MPALSRCGAATVGGTLVAIGALGLYETYAADAHPGGDAPAPPPPPVGRRGAWTLAAGVAAALSAAVQGKSVASQRANRAIKVLHGLEKALHFLAH